MLLKVGENAPTFALPDADMETVDLAPPVVRRKRLIFLTTKGNSTNTIAFYLVSAAMTA